MALQALRPIFRFDAWHAAAPYSCRPYKKAVVDLVNALHPAVVIEVGCGLGDIISRVRARERLGVDWDARVIRAARFLHPFGRWLNGDCISLQKLITARRSIDCLIMVNWIHGLCPSALEQLLLPLLPLTRYLVLDAVDADGPQSYRYKHDFAFLARITREVSRARIADEPRSFIAFESLS
jgi:hypothetical protein